MLFPATVIAIAALTTNAAITKRELGPLTKLTNAALIYYHSDICQHWNEHCERYNKDKPNRPVVSICKPFRHDNGYLTVVEAGCFVNSPYGYNPTTDRIVREWGWQSPDFGILVPHIALQAAEEAQDNPGGAVYDEREMKEYQDYMRYIQDIEKDITWERKATLYQTEYLEYESTFKDQRDRVPQDVYMRLSEVQRQRYTNIIAGSKAKVGWPYPYDATWVKTAQWSLYKDEAYAKFGYNETKSSIENLEQFIEKKSRGEILLYPA